MSHDVNSIENLWQKLKVKINSQAAKSLQELKRVAIEEWITIPHDTTSNLAKNYRKRLLSVIQMKGYAIYYQ